MYSLGIDIGYSSVKLVLMDSNNEVIYNTYILHKGRAAETLQDALEEVFAAYGAKNISRGAVTGSGSKLLTGSGAIQYANEAAAIVEGALHLNPQGRSIIEIGGQNAKYITGFSEHDKSRIEISMNSNCSAGTGSFLEEQVSRLNLKLEEYSVYANRATSIPRIAGRCSVFAKTDITHHQQEGVSVEDILLGLAYAVVKNYRGAVMKRLPRRPPILFIGGVANNQGIMTALHDVLDIDEEELIIPEYFHSVGAVGAAILANNTQCRIDSEQFAASLDRLKDTHLEQQDESALPPLRDFGNNDSLQKHAYVSLKSEETLHGYLGIDVGSTSTNLVLMDRDNTIASYKYLRTFGDPVTAVRMGFRELQQEFKRRIRIVGVGVTGSGRYMIGDLVGADVVKDEITSQAKAAVTLNASVDTIFEIGGQDSKYIGLKNGVVADFQMNKICAAGTGSFLEEQAAKFNIPIGKFGQLALDGREPASLGERCTVFIESSIAEHLTRGTRLEDIASGLCYSIAGNYLNRVVGQKKIGDNIVFQGGLAYNQGVINAFRALLGKEISVPPFFSVTGAYGAALLAKEGMGTKHTMFKGFELENKTQFLSARKNSTPEVSKTTPFAETIEKVIFEGYDGTIDPTQKTVGIPRALFTFGMFPMFHAFFRELGFNVVMSAPTNETTIRLGQEYSLDETCYPVKLINGHVAELVRQGVDYIFFPDLYTVDHPGSSSRQNYGCPYMQLAFKMVKQAMELEKRGISLLSPTIAFSLGKEFMMQSFAELGTRLEKNREQTAVALQKGMQAFHRFEERIEEHGRGMIQGLNLDEKAFVLVSKIYGVADPVLNMGIPDTLMGMGYQAVAFYDLPEGDVSQEHPNMYWPFGQHILEPAYLVKEHPNLYAILLTHHGCGPDTVFAHYFREIMAGKPYLHIEVDEHSSGVGVQTRLEAFLNSLSAEKVAPVDELEAYAKKVVHHPVNLKQHFAELDAETTLYLPPMYPYSEIFAELLVKKGIHAKALPETDRASIALGRRHTLTNEYFSLTALSGDSFKKLQHLEDRPDGTAFFIPQTEGAEVDGQYHRLLRTKFDEEGFAHVDILAPFLEDALYQDADNVQFLCLGVLAGDLVRIAPRKYRKKYLATIRSLIANQRFDIESLTQLAAIIYKDLCKTSYHKRIFASGEPLVLYNDFLNNSIFSAIEEQEHRIVYSPMSEALWMFWRDYLDQNENDLSPIARQRLNEWKDSLRTISDRLVDESPFEDDLDSLIAKADRTVGYYAGAFGRYRAAKLLADLPEIDGIITVTSAYENTGISLNILHKGFKGENAGPLLELTFDGNRNTHDESKIESFLYYL